MPRILRRTRSTVLCSLGLALWVTTVLAAAAQEPGGELPVSRARIRTGLSKPPSTLSKVEIPVEAPVATFKTRVEQRVYMVPFKEWFDKRLELTELQRQSAEWASQCCGLNLNPVFKKIEEAMERRKLRKVREQIASELADLEAARKKAGVAANDLGSAIKD